MKSTLRQLLAGALPAMALLAGCNQMENPGLDMESCDLCHSKPLSDQAVHRIHLSSLAMENFPSRSEKAEEWARALADTALVLKADSALPAAERYRQNKLLANEIACDACHQGVHALGNKVRSDAHRNGKVDVVFDKALLNEKYGGGDRTVYKAGSCDAIACHGSGRKGVEGVTWNTAAAPTDTLGCNNCHNTVKHKVGVRCNLCHFDVTLDGKTITNFKLHVNGVVDVW